VEGAIAKYFATEAGNAAADAAIQAHGGYGYTHEYEVEKIRRDVRITTIYEGTSEILQNIIGTHRWRVAVKTQGSFYRDMASALRERGSGEAAALAAEALAETILACHSKRLPREQYVLMELARLAAEAETAVALAHKAAKGGRRADLLTACARLHGGAAARDVVMTALRLLHGSGRFDEGEIADFRSRVRFEEAVASASGELELMDRVAAALDGERLG
jgi:alkylation response protein AidB-like acyl-CoA dehydrogenase